MKSLGQRSLTILLLVAIVMSAAAIPMASADNAVTPATPVNPNASNEARELLAYLNGLSDGTFNGVIAGQNLGHGIEAVEGYAEYVDALEQQSDELIGMVGVDYEYVKEYTAEELLQTNKVLKHHWYKGGLVTVVWSQTNPWGGDIRPNTREDLNKLLDPEEDVHQLWMSKLDRMAAALKDLQDEGIAVLWRPMQEMNGTWFWWGKTEATRSQNHQAYINVYRHMYDYFTNTKGLNNLLWVFSPTGGQSWSTFPYPGDDVVDIVGGTSYNTNLDAGYNDLMAYGKTVALAELGPLETSEPARTGTFDGRQYINKIRSTYPGVSYWMTWHDWTGVNMSLVKNPGAVELMQDPGVINAGVPWRTETELKLPNKLMNGGFEDGSAGYALWSDELSVIDGTVTETVYSGNRALQVGPLTAGTGFDQALNGKQAGFRAGDSITLSAKVKIDPQGTSGWTAMKVAFKNGEDDTISELQSEIPDTYTTWHEVVIKGVIPDGTENIQFYFWRDTSSAAMYVDEVSVTGIGTAVFDTPKSFPAEPYNGEPLTIPGRIEAEQFDKGNEGQGYHDARPSNVGGKFRPEEGVDIGEGPGEGYHVGWTTPGEWLSYHVTVQEAGHYGIYTNQTTDNQGGTFHLEFDGEDLSGPIQIQNTGGWSTFQEFFGGQVRLEAGDYRVKLVIDSDMFGNQVLDAGNIDYLELRRIDDVPQLSLSGLAHTRVGHAPQYASVAATLEDGSQVDVSDATTYSSSNPAVATVGKVSGKVTAVGEGSAVITAKYGSAAASFEMNVQAAPVVLTGVPVNANASAEAKEVLSYLNKLSSSTFDGAIAGQNLSSGNTALEDYRQVVLPLEQQHGKQLGMVGLDYEGAREYSTEELSQANELIKYHWLTGGLVSISWSPTNPWGDTRNDLHMLLETNEPIHRVWMNKLDRIAAALQELKDAGVVVLWRPMPGMNGTDVWWGKTDEAEEHQAYADVYRHMYDYFTDDKGLNNLLWVFSPTGDAATSSYPYPGGDVVDIVAGNAYNDQLEAGYNDLVAYGKVVAMAELGPSRTSQAAKDGTFNNMNYIHKIKNDYPGVAYWMSGQDAPGIKLSLASNANVSELLNDPGVIHAEVPWRVQTEPNLENALANGGFENDLDGYVTWIDPNAFEIVSEPVFSGSKALQITPAGGVGFETRVFRNLTPGDRIRVKAKVKMSGPSSWTSMALAFKGAEWESDTIGEQADLAIENSDWTNAVIQSAIPEGAGHFQIYFWKDAIQGSTLVIDDITASIIDASILTEPLVDSPAMLTELQLSGLAPMRVGDAVRQSVVTATYSNGSQVNVTGYAAFSSSVPEVASVDSSTGAVSAIRPGTTVITATYGTHYASYTLVVDERQTPHYNGTPVILPTDRFVVDEASLMGTTEEKVVIKLGNAHRRILLPVKSADLLKGTSLTVQSESFTMEIPKETLRQMSELFKDQSGEPAHLIIIAEPIKQADYERLLQPGGNTELKGIGDAFNFTLGAVNKNGDVAELKRFDRPVTIRMKYPDQADLSLAGLYHITEDGTVEYVRSMLSDGYMTGEANHFSTYAILVYKKSYTDVPEHHWAATMIRSLSAKHVVEGKTDSEFAPEATVTRAEFTAMLTRALGLKASEKASFQDVDPGDWFSESVSAAVQAGIVKGRDADRFEPHAKITREEMVVLIMRAVQNLAPQQAVHQASQSDFQDMDEVADWARASVEQALQEGLISGYRNGDFEPKETATRAESATMLYKLINR